MADNPADPFGSGSLFDEFDRERPETAPYLLGNDESISSNNDTTENNATSSQHKLFTDSSSEGSDSEIENGKQKSKNRTTTRGPNASSNYAAKEGDSDMDDDGNASQNGTKNNVKECEVLEMKDRISDLEQIVGRLARENKLIDSTRYQVDEAPGLQVIYMNSSFGRKYKEDIERFIAELVEKDKSDPDSLPRIHPLPSSICLADKKKDVMDSSTYDCVREHHTVLGCSQFYSEYIQDTMGWPLVNHTPALTDGWETPVYDQIFAEALPIEEVEGDKPAQKQKRVVNKPMCFNCGGEHVMRDCKEKKDYAKINAKRAEFMGKSLNSQNSSKNRYHIEDDPRFAKYKAGTISNELREAMGLRENQLPPYIYQMRVHGYPPGHLFDAKVEGSGICLFDRHGREVSNEGESLEEGEVNTTVVKDTYNLEKIVEYPGFNVGLPEGAYDDYRKYNFPPMQDFQLKTRLEEIMGSDMFKRQSEQEGGGRKKKMKVDTSGREELDMDIESGEESGDIKIEVRIENKYMAKVKNDSISSLQSSRNASSASLEDLEHQRELLLRQMEDTDDSQDTQPLDGSQGEGEESDITDVPSPSTPQRSSVQSSNSFISFSTPRSMSISREFGTPLGFDSDQPLPAPEKFSSNITEHIPYENLPNATGMFEKMQNVVKKVRDKYKTFFS
ncbi:zinc finger CCHC domain-containing protein 8-like [Lineus longissimus]|uniref:zinc finger CCHC domain-containing protein 8-like n=1 Tax=Lineus longissimus TaxID=88925 RepID=UPI00315DE259